MPNNQQEERRLQENHESWHNTKGLSVSIILLLLVNIVSTVWWAATLTSDVHTVAAASTIISKNRESIIRVEAKLELYDSTLNKLNQSINRLDSTVSRIDREQAKTEPRLNNLEAKKRKN